MKPYDASNPKDIERVRKLAEQRDDNFRAVMKTREGRAFLYDLIFSVCHADDQSFVIGRGDASAFNEGARSIGGTVRATALAIDKSLYLLMLKENLT